MQQPHQHGPHCRHGHGHGHGHPHGGHGHHPAITISPKEYFEKISQMKKKNPQFYWIEILNGNIFNKYCEEKGWEFVKSISCQVLTMIVAQAEMMFTCQWLPLWIRPFVSGLFFPLVFLLFFNINVVYGVTNLQFTSMHMFSYLAVLFYFLAAVRTPGIIDIQWGTTKTKQALRERQYLQNPGLSCPQCKTLKIFRSFHCPICKVCIKKFTRHSVAFGCCIGAANELMALGFFFCLTIAEILTLEHFFLNTNYGIITNIMFYALNIFICWSSFVETATIFVMNFWYGLTEHEARMWMMSQYLMKVPERQFTNSVGKGIINNIVESLYALFGISGYQSQKRQINQSPLQQQMPISGDNQFQKLQQGKIYIINWNKAFFYLVPQLPSHPCRDNVISMMKRQEPKMKEMYKLQKKFKQEVLKETEGQGLNQFQIQQRVAIKMQQHMMRNAQNIMPQMNQPSQQQQKMIQIQMLTHMIAQLQEKQPQMTDNLKQLLQGLKQNTIDPMQVGIAMRQIQQQLMRKQMQAVIKQRQQLEKSKLVKEQKETVKDEDQEEQLKTREIADEDL